jgi:hypothetical protein
MLRVSGMNAVRVRRKQGVRRERRFIEISSGGDQRFGNAKHIGERID